MAIVTLFLISVILAHINIEPFTITGIMLSVCFLPGLSLFAVIKRDKLLFEDLLLAFPTSVGLSGFLTLGMLFQGVPVKYVLPVVQLITGGTLLFCFIARIKNKAFLTLELNKREIYFVVFALVITLLLSIPFFVGPNRGPIASHAFHHSSFVSQILNGIFPPENPGLGGTVIGYYWGFHAFIAALTVNTDFHHLQIIFTINAISLFMIMCIAYSFGRSFKLAETYCYIIPFAIIGLMRFDAGIFFVYKWLSGNIISIKTMASQYQYVLPYNVLSSWMEGITWLDTRLLYMNKFYNISAMPMSISQCSAYFLVLLLLLNRKFRDKKIYSISLGIIIMASVLYYPPLAIVLLLHAPIWICYIFISAQGRFREKLSETSKIALPYLIAVLAVSPYMFLILSNRDVSSSAQGSLLSFDFYAQSIKNLAIYLIPFPLIIAGVWAAYDKLSFSREFYLLLIGTAVCFGLTVFTRWPFDNSYKFNYILVFFFAQFFVFALSKLLSMSSSRWGNRFIISGTVLLLLSSTLIVEAAYIVSSLNMDRHINYSNGHIIYAKDEAKNEAYAWIRENTPPEALLMLSYVKTPIPCCGLNPNYEVAAIAERNLYVIKDTDYTTSNPEYAKRIMFREKLFEDPEGPGVMDFFISLKRPVYLLLEKDLTDRVIVEERFKTFPTTPGGPFELVFHNDRQRVYHMRLNK